MNFFKGKLDVGEAFSTVSSGIDKMVFSEEERSDINREVADAQIEFIKTTASENTVRSVTRRYLALAIMGVFLILILSAAVIGAFNGEYADFIFELATSLNTLVIMVATFFFGGYYANKFVADRRQKREKKQ